MMAKLIFLVVITSLSFATSSNEYKISRNVCHYAFTYGSVNATLLSVKFEKMARAEALARQAASVDDVEEIVKTAYELAEGFMLKPSSSNVSVPASLDEMDAFTKELQDRGVCANQLMFNDMFVDMFYSDRPITEACQHFFGIDTNIDKSCGGRVTSWEEFSQKLREVSDRLINKKGELLSAVDQRLLEKERAIREEERRIGRLEEEVDARRKRIDAINAIARVIRDRKIRVSDKKEYLDSKLESLYSGKKKGQGESAGMFLVCDIASLVVSYTCRREGDDVTLMINANASELRDMCNAVIGQAKQYELEFSDKESLSVMNLQGVSARCF